MKERKSIMKKESKTKKVILIVFIVLSLGYLAYEKFDISFNEITLFERDLNKSSERKVANISNDFYGDNTEGISETILSIMPLFLSLAVLLAIISLVFSSLFREREDAI